ncbi:hypothetical protein LTR66_017568, partial [Elasticomyces elasticus]
MFGFDEARDARDQVYNQDNQNQDPDNQPKFSHELAYALNLPHAEQLYQSRK